MYFMHSTDITMHVVLTKHVCKIFLTLRMWLIINVHIVRIRVSLFSYTQKKIECEKYKLRCYIMKRGSLSIIVSYINVAVNQTGTYKI